MSFKTRRTFILPDSHGRLDCLVSILQAGGVIDGNLDWTFDGDRLVCDAGICVQNAGSAQSRQRGIAGAGTDAAYGFKMRGKCK